MQDLAGYHELIARKRIAFEPRGLASVPSLSADLKPHQAHCVDFALRQGCSGLYLDTGLGKTFCALEWGRVVVEHTNRPVLMLAPLAVSKQHEREASRWGIDAVSNPNYPTELWQQEASPVWDGETIWNYRLGQSGKGDYDLRATEVLNVKAAKDEEAIKHLCPMPLNVTRRALTLWSAPDDVVFSPFMGIGSEGWESLKAGRRFIGTELKSSYYATAVQNLREAAAAGEGPDMFASDMESAA